MFRDSQQQNKTNKTVDVSGKTFSIYSPKRNPIWLMFQLSHKQ